VSFSDYFPVIQGFSLTIHTGLTMISQFFSECWLVDPVQWPVGPFYLSLPPWLKPFVTPLIIFVQNKKCKKEDILTFLNVLGYYFISHEKSGHVLQREDVW